MRFGVPFFIFASALLAAAPSAHAATVFESIPGFATAGPTKVGSICSTCQGYGGAAASFSLGSSQTLNRAFVLLSNGFETTNMQVFIFADGGNNLPASSGPGGSGTLPPLFFQDYTTFSSLTAEPGDTTLAELALPGWTLGAGNYWIAFQSYLSTGVPFFLTETPEHSRMVGTDFGFYNGPGRGITYNPGDRTIGFSLNAVETTSAVPEPATWAMMLLGFGVLGSALRRQRVATRAALTIA